LNYILKHTGIRHSFAFVLFRLIIAGLVTVGQAGTNPNEATRLEYDEYNNTWSFTWWGHVGNTYFIQQSDDLLSWQYMPFIIEGENKVAEWQFSNDQNTTFVRLKFTDMPTSDPRKDDFDNDDINNWNELLQQSDPFATDDQNSNGIADDWELFWNDQFAVFPRTVSATLTHRDSTIQQLYLNNPVSPDTNFTVTLSNNLAGTQIVYDYEDNLTGGAIYNWTEISTTGTLLADISETDNAAQEVVLNNFTFPFYGTSYDQVYVASNGLLTFDSPSADSGNDAIPYEYEPNNFIALLWDDLNTNDAIADDGGEVYFQEFADRMIVQYERVMRDYDSDRSTQSNTFQVVLHASGLIDVHYKEIGGYTGSTTIGIEDSSGTNGIEVFYNGYRTIYPTFELSNGLALSYTPQSAKFVQVSPLTGTTTTGSSSTLEVNFNSYDLAPGTYATDIEIAHSGTGTTPWIITAVLEVINTPATINLYQPLDGQVYWSDETVTFSAYVYDSDFGIERVDYLVNGAVEDQDISGSYYSGSWSPTVGQHEVIARAVDLYGTTTDSVVVTITVLADSDFDRMEDEWEQQYFGSLAEEASADFDGDGIPNIFEYNHGTDPADALSKLTFAETQTSDYTYFLVDETLATETDVAKTSLSAAINRANDFDVIEVRPGTYHEALGTLYDRLYVFSTAGARNTTIDTSGLDDRALTLRSESVFSGLSFRGADSEYTYFDGGAVYLSIYGDQNKPRFIGCRFIDNVVGDPSGSHSEHWEMTITGLGADTRVMRLSNRNFGTMTVPTPYKLWKDSNYEITIAHLGTKQTENGPDYDWQAQVEGLPTTNVLSGGATHTDASRFSVIHNHWILDNEDGLLGIVNQSFNNSNYASDKSAKLLKVEFGYPNIANKEINTKNLATTEYGDFEKCVARVWSSSTIEMNDYLENWNTMPSEVKELLEWEVDGNIQTSSNLNIGSVPFDHEISFFKIGVKVKGTPQILDRLILTVIPESTETNFNAWYSSESSDTGWLGELPPLYNNLGVENNDPEPAACDPQLWKSPDSKNSLYHPGASFEMRSVETSAGHGHQAMYRFNGALITSGLGAGSADRASPSIFSTSHRNQDVRPFIWAAQLDGNPIQGNSTTFPTNLNQPILHDGDNLAKYFDVRPIIANGRPSLSPGDCETQQE